MTVVGASGMLGGVAAASECAGTGSGDGFKVEVCTDATAPGPQVVSECDGQCTSIYFSGGGSTTLTVCYVKAGQICIPIPILPLPQEGGCLVSVGAQVANESCRWWVHG